MVDTDVYAANTVEQMLIVKQFNRAVVLDVCLIPILIYMKYLHDQEICYQAV